MVLSFDAWKSSASDTGYLGDPTEIALLVAAKKMEGGEKSTRLRIARPKARVR